MDSRDSYFDTSSRSWGHAAPHWHRYLFATQFAGNGTVLVIGCETGYGAAELAKKARSVVAMDSRKELLDVARKKYSESNIEYVCGVFPDCELRNSDGFDLVVCFDEDTLLESASTGDILKKINSLIAPSGRALLSFPVNSLQMLSLEEKLTHLTIPQRLRHLLEQSFANVSLFDQDVWSASFILPHERTGASDFTEYHLRDTVDGIRPDAMLREGETLLAICSHGLITGFPSSAAFHPGIHSSSHRLSVATLFLPVDGQFSEAHCLKESFYWSPPHRLTFAFPIPDQSVERVFRFDPGEEPCIIQIHRVGLTNSSRTHFLPVQVSANGQVYGENVWVFPQPDPQVYCAIPVELASDSITTLVLELDILAMGAEFGSFFELYSGTLADLQNLLERRDEECQKLTAEIHDLREELAGVQMSLENSRESALQLHHEKTELEATQRSRNSTVHFLKSALAEDIDTDSDHQVLSRLSLLLLNAWEEMARLNPLLETSVKHSAQLQASIAQKDATLGHLQNERQRLVDLRQLLEQQVEDKDRHITNLEGIINHRETRILQLEESLRHQKNAASRLGRSLEHHKQSWHLERLEQDYHSFLIERHRKEKEEKIVVISQLQKQVEEQEKTILDLNASFSLRFARLIGQPLRWWQERFRGRQSAVDSGSQDELFLPPETFSAALPRLARARPELSSGEVHSFSVVVPVFDAKLDQLQACIQSVFDQTYTHWELLLVDDNSTDAVIIPYLQAVKGLDNRVNVLQHNQNKGISAATNAGVSVSQGKWIALLDHDDCLVPEALMEVALAIDQNPSAKAFYTDQDKIDSQGRHIEPYLKPDWSPAFFESVMYIGHLLVFDSDLWNRAGGFDSYFDGVQDYEFMLRLSALTDKIVHIPKVLYHWRISEGSVADRPDAKSRLGDLQQLAIYRHLGRVGYPAVVMPGNLPHRISLLPLPDQETPLVSIVIPTRDSPDLLGNCLKGLFSQTTYPHIEVILVDNQTTDAEALDLMKKYDCKIVPFDRPFNYSAANNLGVQYASGEYLVFLNNDIEISEPDWVQNMLYYARQKDVGAVGALLEYPNGMVQHAGIVLGFRGTADHLMRGMPVVADGYHGSLHCAREVMAVTGACLMVKRTQFDRAGGFREEYANIYQDVDLCLEFHSAGYRNIYAPSARHVHHESASRDASTYDLLDRALLLDRWGELIEQGDPYYHPDFATEGYGHEHAGYVMKMTQER